MTTRDRIVQAADQLFYRQGFEHTSFSDIADDVQISRGNFYYHFKTKDEILDAVINVRLVDTGETCAEREHSFHVKRRAGSQSERTGASYQMELRYLSSSMV